MTKLCVKKEAVEGSYPDQILHHEEMDAMFLYYSVKPEGSKVIFCEVSFQF